MPPTRKKNIAVAPYMIAIFLWSTVVNQLQKPVVDCGRSRIRARRVGAWTSAVASSTVVIGHYVTPEQVVGIVLGVRAAGHRRLTLRRVLA